MKKKFLSLMMAAAVVATTSVSAFAADKTIKDSDTIQPTTNVQITGKVLNEDGTEAPGTFNVTVPTTATFTVTGKAELLGTKIKVKNDGIQDIDVYAEKFVDTNQNSGINVVAEGGLGTVDRTNVSLSLGGTLGTVHLKSEPITTENKGLYKDKAFAEKATGESLKLTTIQAGDEEELTLEGKAGKGNTQQPEAVNDTFTLTLKIKKSTGK